MKLRRINDTKFPTEKQLKDIIFNLKQKYPRDKFVISSELSSTKCINYYSVYRHSGPGSHYPIIGKEWPDFLSEYRSFMKGE
jgi:hypothetical protein